MILSVDLFEPLSPHFKMYEFLMSDTRSAYHNALNVNVFNHHPHRSSIISRFKELSDLLEIIRSNYKRPIFITSGFRCPTVNAYFVGSPKSYHLSGRAVDIKYTDELANICKKYRSGLTELIINKDKNYIHIAL